MREKFELFHVDMDENGYSIIPSSEARAVMEEESIMEHMLRSAALAIAYAIKKTSLNPKEALASWTKARLIVETELISDDTDNNELYS